MSTPTYGDAPVIRPVALDANGQLWETKPNVRLEKVLEKVEMREDERRMVRAHLVNHNWARLMYFLSDKILTAPDGENKNRLEEAMTLTTKLADHGDGLVTKRY
jgi:hypothetical protein